MSLSPVVYESHPFSSA